MVKTKSNGGGGKGGMEKAGGNWSKMGEMEQNGENWGGGGGDGEKWGKWGDSGHSTRHVGVEGRGRM